MRLSANIFWLYDFFPISIFCSDFICTVLNSQSSTVWIVSIVWLRCSWRTWWVVNSIHHKIIYFPLCSHWAQYLKYYGLLVCSWCTEFVMCSVMCYSDNKLFSSYFIDEIDRLTFEISLACLVLRVCVLFLGHHKMSSDLHSLKMKSV